MHVLTQPHEAFAHRAHGIAASRTRQHVLLTTGVNCQQRQTLRHVIVQLAREPRALVFLRGDEMPAQFARSLLCPLALSIRAAQAPAVQKQHDDEDGLEGAERGRGDDVPLVLFK